MGQGLRSMTFAAHAMDFMVLVNDGCHCVRVDIAQIVVNQDISKPADSRQGTSGVFGLQCLGQLLRSFRQGLQVVQGRVVQHLILDQVASGLHLTDPLNSIQNVPGARLPGFAYSSITSCKTCTRMWRFSSCSSTSSTGRWCNWDS